MSNKTQKETDFDKEIEELLKSENPAIRELMETIKKLEEKYAPESKCSCEIGQLMNKGCNCGHLKK